MGKKEERLKKVEESKVWQISRFLKEIGLNIVFITLQEGLLDVLNPLSVVL